MILTRRACACPALFAVGTHVTAFPMSLRGPVTGAIVEVDRYTVSISTRSGRLIAVDAEDCSPRPHERDCPRADAAGLPAAPHHAVRPTPIDL